MAPFGSHFPSASPILTMAAQPAHPALFGPRQFPHQAGQSATPTAVSQSQSQPRGRKRSRDEASVNLDSTESFPEIALKPVKPSQGRAAFLPQSYIARSGSQIRHGIAPQQQQQQAPQQQQQQQAQAQAQPAHSQPAQQQEQQRQQGRPALRSHKSQRLDRAALGRQDSSSDSPTTRASSSSAGPQTSLSSGEASQPVVDDFTVHLGIGWRRISEDVDIQAAARGWAKYIENHYPISDAKICIESKGLQSYLVETAEGYFLFADSLKQGRLVSRTVEGALKNLKTMPPTFEAEEIVAQPQSVSAAAAAAAAVAAAATEADPAVTAASVMAPATIADGTCGHAAAADVDMGIF